MNTIAAVTSVPSRRRETAAYARTASAIAGTAHSTDGSLFRGPGGTLVEVRWLLRFAAAAALASGLVVAPAQGAAPAPTLLVSFFTNGQITVTLPDGTPVGSTSGAPTVIPAGYYSVLMDGPGGCIQLPLFQLSGPGASIVSDMNGGEVDASTFNAFFLPNSTYTWHTDRGLSSAVHTFTTSGTIAAPATTQTTTTTPVTSSGTPTSNDIVGSAIAPFRGTLTAAVGPSGALSLQHFAPTMKAGRYRLTVNDKSDTRGLQLRKATAKPLSLTGAAFTGKRIATITLTTGTWSLTNGKSTVKIVVH
jgi:hypothetical protein